MISKADLVGYWTQVKGVFSPVTSQSEVQKVAGRFSGYGTIIAVTLLIMFAVEVIGIKPKKIRIGR